jgi:hypothetical protein
MNIGGRRPGIQAELARLGHVSRARLTQILNLAPDIQETFLILSRVEHGRDPFTELDLRPIAVVADWGVQREMWEATQASLSSPSTTPSRL